MKVSGQIIVALGLAGSVLAIVLHESSRTEEEPKIIEWARVRNQASAVRPEGAPEAGDDEEYEDMLDVNKLLDRGFAARGVFGEEPGEEGLVDRLLTALGDRDIGALLRQVFTGAVEMSGDSAELFEQDLKRQYDDWEFLPGLDADSVLDDPRMQEQLLRQGNPYTTLGGG